MDFEQFAALDRVWTEPSVPDPIRGSASVCGPKTHTAPTIPIRVNKSVGPDRKRVHRIAPRRTATLPEPARAEEEYVSSRIIPMAATFSASSQESQESHYNGDTDFEDAINCLEDEEEEVEDIIQTQTRKLQTPSRTSTTSSISTSSLISSDPHRMRASSFSSAESPSTAPTSVFASRTTSFNSPASPSGGTIPVNATLANRPISPISPYPKAPRSGRQSASKNKLNTDVRQPSNKRKACSPTPVDQSKNDPFLDAGSSTASNCSTTREQSVKPKTAPSAPSSSFLDGTPIIIAHSDKAQRMMEMRQIAWGVQYEIAYGVTRGSWQWTDVTEKKLDELKGSNACKAHQVGVTMSAAGAEGSAMKRAGVDLSIYRELDREQAAIIENKERGLGLMGTWHGKEKWYGGRVQQVARLTSNSKAKFATGVDRYVITLDKLEQRRSNQYSRFLGSRRVLQIRIPTDLMKEGDDIAAFIARKVVLCGRVFSPFMTKEQAIYLVETSDFERHPSESEGDHFRLSWNQFIDWYNPLRLNGNQPIRKWSTRFALGLSTSVPVLEFLLGDIMYIKDEFATINPPFGKPRTEQIMTDGCGYMNQAALAVIANAMGTPRLSIAVQGRIAGAKGMWTLHPDPRHHDLMDRPKIWIRASQKKINLEESAKHGRAHRIFDLVRVTRLTAPSSLYMQTIENIAHNGIADGVFQTLMEKALREQVQPLMDWRGTHASTRLYKAVEAAGKVVGSRLGHETALAARALGFIRDEGMHGEDDFVDDIDYDGNFGMVERNEISGCPASLYEVVLELLQAGFTPLELPLLRKKLGYIIQNTIETYLRKYHITIPLSAEAFLIPDPFGVLDEGQIHFRSSQTIGDATKCVDPYTFVGPVLLTRNPTRVASDVRKVTAVSHDQLLCYVDVIVCSIKGVRSAASWLGGGDYDGDTATVIAEPSLVDGFHNPEFTHPPDDLHESFENEVEIVPDFMKRIEVMTPAMGERETRNVLLLGLFDSKVGIYSAFHDNAVYTLGYDHKETIRMAFMFMTCLDSSKTGLRVKDSVFKKDRKFGRRPPCMQTVDAAKAELLKGENIGEMKRAQGLPCFVLDTLMNFGKKIEADLLTSYANLTRDIPCRKDRDLSGPLDESERNAHLWTTQHKTTVLTDELRLIKNHVESTFKAYKTQLSQKFNDPKSPQKRGSPTKRSKPGTTSQSRSAIIHELAKSFGEGPPGLVFTSQLIIPAIKASYAYVHCTTVSQGKLAPSFPFDMAHKDLCLIKAKAHRFVTSTSDFADLKTMHGTLLDARARSGEES